MKKEMLCASCKVESKSRDSKRSHFLDQVTDVLTKDFEGSMYYFEK